MVASTLVAGTALMTAAPGAVSFVVAHAVILPLSSLYGQLFAQARLAAQRAGPQGDGAATRDGIMATIRALMALVTVAGALVLVWVDRRSAG